MRKINYQSLKVGKILPNVEQAFHTSFAYDVNIYYLEQDLNALASKHPNSYLKMVEEISRILENPDIVCYMRKDLVFTYFRLYIDKKGIKVLGVNVRLCGHPNKWVIGGAKWYDNASLIAMQEEGEFRRIPPKKKKVSKKENQ